MQLYNIYNFKTYGILYNCTTFTTSKTDDILYNCTVVTTSKPVMVDAIVQRKIRSSGHMILDFSDMTFNHH